MSVGRRWRATLIVVLGSSLAACGVPTEDHPRIVEREEVPFGLVRDHPPTTTAGPDSSRAR
jgi:hypothetical protein